MTVSHHGFGSAAKILHREQIVQENRNLRLHDRAFHAGQAAAEVGEQLIIHALVSIAQVRNCGLQPRHRKLCRKDILELANLRFEESQRLCAGVGPFTMSPSPIPTS